MRIRGSVDSALALEAGAALILIGLAAHERRGGTIGTLALAIGAPAGAAALLGALPIRGRPLIGWLRARVRMYRAARRPSAAESRAASATAATAAGRRIGFGRRRRVRARAAPGAPVPGPPGAAEHPAGALPASRRPAAPESTGLIRGVPSALFGEVSVELFPTRRGARVAAIRRGSTWTVALAIGADRPGDLPPPAPLREMASLLRIDGVPLAAVRLLATVDDPAGAIDRHLLLSLDALEAAAEINARGGSSSALGQLLRRVAARAQDLLRVRGIEAAALEEDALRRLARSSLAQLAPVRYLAPAPFPAPPHAQPGPPPPHAQPGPPPPHAQPGPPPLRAFPPRAHQGPPLPAPPPATPQRPSAPDAPAAPVRAPHEPPAPAGGHPPAGYLIGGYSPIRPLRDDPAWLERWNTAAVGADRSSTIAFDGPAELALALTRNLMAPGLGPLRSSALVAARQAPRAGFVLLARTRDDQPATLAAVRAAAERAGLHLDTLGGRQGAGLLLAHPAGIGGSAARGAAAWNSAARGSAAENMVTRARVTWFEQPAPAAAGDATATRGIPA